MENNELYHHGVKGMQWGKRLYQNQDGSLTALGRARYAVKKARATAKRKATIAKKKKAAESEQKLLEKKKKQAADKRKATLEAKKKAESQPPKIKKSVNEMSDAELKKAIARAQDEDKYLSLRPEKVPGIKKFMGSLVNDVIAPSAVAAGKDFLTNALKKAGSDLLKDKVDPDSIEALTKKRDKLKLKNEIGELIDPSKKKPNLDEEQKRFNLEKSRYDFDRQKKKDAKQDYEDAQPKGPDYAKEKQYWDWRSSVNKVRTQEYNMAKTMAKDYAEAKKQWEADSYNRQRATTIINDMMDSYGKMSSTAALPEARNLLTAPKDD